jgi:hypothetical protein
LAAPSAFLAAESFNLFQLHFVLAVSTEICPTMFMSEQLDEFPHLALVCSKPIHDTESFISRKSPMRYILIKRLQNAKPLFPAL